MSVRSKTSSILNMTCPRCREGKLFVQPYSFSTAYKMHQKCPICQQNFEPEPGFYYGAMFISYILTGWIFILVGLALVFGLGWSGTMTILAVGFIAVVLHNLFFRFSRSLWIHVFVKYDPAESLSQNGHDS
ncbi:MAG: DUF983 domain-containing protein [Saprospiraceae bacterium]|nr:DUF983 domain-containing protein [Saprospiraceae bacterium]